MAERLLVTAPAGSGKTTYAIEAILRAKEANPLATIWVLLPSSLQVGAFRERLIAQHGAAVIFGVQFYNFYELYNHLLERLHIPKRQINQAAVFRVLRHILDDPTIRQRLTYFTPILEMGGFVDVMSKFIFELKQAHISEKQFMAYAKQRNDKDFDTALIYEAYQQFLRENDLVDREGAGWLALAKLDETYYKLDGVDLLVVDGFTQFSPLQAQLLNILSDYIPQTLLTLTLEASRATTIHRSFDRTLKRLTSYDRPWTHHRLTVQNTWQHPALIHLEEQFMSPIASGIDAQEVLQLLEAPDSETEVRMVLREVKRRLLDGTAPEEIAVLVKDMQPYADLLRMVAHQYHLPLHLREGIALSKNPAIASLLQLLHLTDRFGENFRRQAVMDILRNPYFMTGFSLDDLAALERLSLRYKVVGGRDNWLDAIDLALHHQEIDAETADIDEEERIIPALPAIDDTLLTRLEKFFNRITPPTAALPHEFVAWLEELIGIDPAYQLRHNLPPEDSEEMPPDTSLQMYAAMRHEVQLGDLGTIYEASQALITRDLHAMRQLRACLLDMLAAYDLVAGEPIEWRSFLADLERMLQFVQTEAYGSPYRSGHVLATTVFEARGLPHNHVFIMGLSEGRFPIQRTEDPLYSDLERRQMQQAGIQVTTTQLEEDDTSVFYTCAAMAQQTLTLSRPTIDEKANLWSASILWQATRHLLTNPRYQHVAAGAPPVWDAIADERELTVHVAHNLSYTQLNAAAAANYQALADQFSRAGLWTNIRTARTVERLRRQQFDEYSGIVTTPALQEYVHKLLDEGWIWSASQFNEFGTCPYRFFASRLLKLAEFEEPSEGLDIMQLGTLQHEILEYVYNRFRVGEMPIMPEQLDHALDILRVHASEVFADAPARLQFRASPLWQMEQDEIMRRLDLLIRADFNGTFDAALHKKLDLPTDEPRFVDSLEYGFGFDQTPPLTLQGQGLQVMARGRIDRIDRIGNQYVLIDYKSGTAPPKEKELAQARNFQMMLYIRAADQIFLQDKRSSHIAGGVFWSMKSPDNTEIINTASDSLLIAENALLANVAMARRADFRVQPNGQDDDKCYKYCDFHQLCRETRADRFKS